jgi:wyosine [tRNA(Phe)-imidazoG37] synthetase (radical SAM superfamily)
LGRTINKTIIRKEYVSAEKVLYELKRKLAMGETIDFISLAGSGEPTLNCRIGFLIREIKRLTDIPLSIITNGSLLWMKEVQDALLPADLVIPSLDAGSDRLFRHVNRPHKGIKFRQMVKGISSFVHRFKGEVWMEVLLISGATGLVAEVKKIDSLIGQISPARVQLNTVYRPPAEEAALPVPSDRMILLKDFFSCNVEIIEGLRDREVSAAVLCNVNEEDIMTLLDRRPCTARDVASGLGLNVAEAIKILEELLDAGKIDKRTTGKNLYYNSIHRDEQYRN